MDDHLLYDAARIVRNAAVVAHDDFDLPPGYNFAILLDIKLDCGRKLPAGGIEARPGQGNADSHLENFQRAGVTGKNASGGRSRPRP